MRDYEGLKMLDPQCAPDVRVYFKCRCESCGHEWSENNEPESCPNCNEGDKDAFTFRMKETRL